MDIPRTRAMKAFLVKEAYRVVDMTIEPDGVFIYTKSADWDDGNGSGTFRGDSETQAIKRFYRCVRRNSAGRS